MLPSDEGPESAACVRATRVYVMRHGQSTYNAEGRFQGCCDEPDLTQAGIAAADAAGTYLRAAGLRAVITSPLRRASHTAVHIYERAWRSLSEGPCFALNKRLREIELPLWEGLPLTTVRREFEEQYRTWRDQPHLFRMPEDCRPVAALFARAGRFWPWLLKRFAGNNVLLVTHGGTGRALIGTALDIPQERFHAIQQSNGGINVLEFPNHNLCQARLSAVNATDYLGERLPKLKESKTGVRILVVPAGGADPLQLRRATEVLRNIRIDAAFGDSVTNREVALRLLRGGRNSGIHPGIIEELPRLGIPAESLATLLWVVHERLLSRTLAEVLGLRHCDTNRLFVVPFTFTVLHYPSPGRAPVLQAMNLHDVGRLTGELDRQVSVRCA